MTDRDFLFSSSIYETEEGGFLMLSNTVERKDVPPKKGLFLFLKNIIFYFNLSI